MKILRICIPVFFTAFSVNSAVADFLINDDLIVDGSACVGFDCVSGEDFGYDTIRLKENNLRIKFDDTSTAASYPRNDWQLTANDSANGGQARFSIDDITGNRTPFTVEANARSHSLYVDDGGRIGSRTSTPSTEIHTIDGDTPTLRLQQDGSSGFAPQTWDVAGNETNFFIRDVTNGSQLPFRIRPGAPSSSIYIDVDGDVGLGTSSPDGAMHVIGKGIIENSDSNSTSDAQLLVRAVDNSYVLNIENDGPARFSIHNTDFANPWRLTHGSNNTLAISIGGAPLEFILNDSGDLTISGELTTGGTTCGGGGCDIVFDPETKIDTIEEHASKMLQKRFLPAVGPTKENAPMNISQKTGGMLNELEKAHLYIVQLNDRLKKLEESNAALLNQIAKMQNNKPVSGN